MKIRLVEYKNIVDNKGNAFGHGRKVLYEAQQISHLAGYNTEVVACDAYINRSYDGKFIQLLNAINVAQYDYKHILTIMSNLRDALRNIDADFVWFTNIDWYLFLYLALYHKKKKIIVTTYCNIDDTIDLFEKKGIIGKIVANIMKIGIRSVDLFIETYYRKDRNQNAIYMPDYLYTDYYKKYKENEKRNRIICIGTMNAQKDLDSMVKVFSRTDYQVEIKGEFVDKKRYQKLLEIKTPNIDIQDRYLSDADYYDELSSSEYVIVPYNMEIYGSATSGVVREALYMGVKVLAPQKLLDNMGISIKGYKNLEDVISLMGEMQKYEEDNLQKYSVEDMAEKLKKRLNNMI